MSSKHSRFAPLSFSTRASMLGAVALTTALVAGCNDPAKDKVKAQTTEAAQVVAPAATAATYRFDGNASKIEWVGSKVTGKHDGGFKTFTGTISVVDKNAEKSSVQTEIDATSLFSDNEKLTGHLKTGDFFEVDKFPKASFQSTKIVPGGQAGAPFTVTGNLTLHGVTKGISFPAKIAVNDDAVTVDAEFVINRKDFGILYAGKADDLIRDDVVIKLAIRANKAG